MRLERGKRAESPSLWAWHPRPSFGYNSIMAKKPPSPFPFPPKRVYRGANIPMRVIRRYARAIAEEFQPDKIILFGSYAYGTPHEDSDVDLLVVMPNRTKQNQAVRIQWRLTAPFPMDLLVRTPKELKRRLEEGDSFMTTIMSKGKVLYEKDDQWSPGGATEGSTGWDARNPWRAGNPGSRPGQR